MRACACTARRYLVVDSELNELYFTPDPTRYPPTRPNPQTEKESHCQLEVDIVYDRLIGHQPEGKWNKLAPLRILSFDIECQVRACLL